MKIKKIALLIDADNANAKLAHNILAEAGIYGHVTIRRIYGDWTSDHLKNWIQKIHQLSFVPIQKFTIGKNKNSTDTALIIDAMDILHNKTVTGFCIASSDSDYTGLAQRIREEGLFVMGIGESKKTSEIFINACDVFVMNENLSNEKSLKEVAKLPQIDVNKEPKLKLKDLPINKITQKPLDIILILKAYGLVVGENNMAKMNDMATSLRKLDPSFDCRTYSSGTFRALFKRMPELFEIVYIDEGNQLFLKYKG
ncbi:MAG: NYN domain-containing protein [Chitinophagales bacterium]|jgi:uncharacterized LabA/DUF88 family protein|nr:NYN domain-containing protein [Chitinophagales bacterium]